MEIRKNTAAVILAAGSGKRMGGATAKQFLPLCGKPVLYWTLKAFEESVTEDVVLVVSDEEAKSFCQKEIIEKYGFGKVRGITFGGAERYDSVWRGLACLKMLESLSETTEESAGAGGKGVFAVPDLSMHVSYERSGSDDADGSGEMTPELVAIHDGARCLVTPAIISRAFADAETYGAAVCAMPVKDTIKIADEGGFAKETPDRRTLFLMQTPQTFSFPLIHDAYEAFVRAKEREENGGKYAAVTDDAEVLEWMTGKRSFLSEGSYENIKITTPEDMLLAEAIIRSR